jgi:hypothetical protein
MLYFISVSTFRTKYIVFGSHKNGKSYEMKKNRDFSAQFISNIHQKYLDLF